MISRRRFATQGSVIVLMLVTVAGCGGRRQPDASQLTDLGRLRTVVNEVSANAETADRFAVQFAEGATVPESERSKYAAPMSFMLKSADISGDSATLTVEVYKSAEEGGQDERLGEVEWTAVKETRWKLKTIALPR